jgi:hypothetical protein
MSMTPKREVLRTLYKNEEASLTLCIERARHEGSEWKTTLHLMLHVGEVTQTSGRTSIEILPKEQSLLLTALDRAVELMEEADKPKSPLRGDQK